jgi:DNA (cytosine-5)-methyltransferase 1
MVRTFDMFCGAGGSSYGAAIAGADIVGGIDAWPLAVAVYSDNFPDAVVIEERVEELQPGELIDKIGPIELLLASPECTHHSCARGARPRSETSRQTAWQVIRYARAMQPRWIIIENVIQMRSWSGYVDLERELQSEGYQIAEHVLDAADFGVPQRRRRLFLLCDREAAPPSRIPRKRGRKRSAASILDKPGTWKRSLLDEDIHAPATIERAERGFAELGRDARFLIVYYGSDGAGGWQPLTVPLRTITTLDRFGLCEPSPEGPTLRMLQVPELCRAMGFPEYLAPKRGSRRDRIMLTGNSVCPPVMAAAVDALVGPHVRELQRIPRRIGEDQDATQAQMSVQAL